MFSLDSLDKSLKVHLSLRALGDENDGINDSILWRCVSAPLHGGDNDACGDEQTQDDM